MRSAMASEVPVTEAAGVGGALHQLLEAPGRKTRAWEAASALRWTIGPNALDAEPIKRRGFSCR